MKFLISAIALTLCASAFANQTETKEYLRLKKQYDAGSRIDRGNLVGTWEQTKKEIANDCNLRLPPMNASMRRPLILEIAAEQGGGLKYSAKQVSPGRETDGPYLLENGDVRLSLSAYQVLNHPHQQFFDQHSRYSFELSCRSLKGSSKKMICSSLVAKEDNHNLNALEQVIYGSCMSQDKATYIVLEKQ